MTVAIEGDGTRLPQSRPMVLLINTKGCVDPPRSCAYLSRVVKNTGAVAPFAVLIVSAFVSACGAERASQPPGASENARQGSAQPVSRPPQQSPPHGRERHTASSKPNRQVPIPKMVNFEGPPYDVVPGAASPTLPYVLDDTFRLRGGAHAVPLRTRRAYGCVGAQFVRSPGGRYVLFTSPVGGSPALRLLDLKTRHTSTFRRDACDPAWSHDGKIAYLALRSYHPNSLHSLHGRTVVQQGLKGRPITWTAGTYGPLAWAGPHLLSSAPATDLAHQHRPGSLRILSGPRQVRSIPGLFVGSESGPYNFGRQASLIALSPSGNRALLDIEEPVKGYARDVVELLDVRRDRIVSRLVLPNTETALASDGYWSGRDIVTTDTVYGGFSSHPPPALAILAVRHGRVQLGSERGFTYQGRPLSSQDLTEIDQARFLGSTDDEVGSGSATPGAVNSAISNAARTPCGASRVRPSPRRPTKPATSSSPTRAARDAATE